MRVESPAKRSDDLSLNADLPGLLSHNLEWEKNIYNSNSNTRKSNTKYLSQVINLPCLLAHNLDGENIFKY